MLKIHFIRVPKKSSVAVSHYRSGLISACHNRCFYLIVLLLHLYGVTMMSSRAPFKRSNPVRVSYLTCINHYFTAVFIVTPATTFAFGFIFLQKCLNVYL